MTSKNSASKGARLVSVLLAVLLVTTLVPVLAFANGDEEQVGTTTEQGDTAADGSSNTANMEEESTVTGDGAEEEPVTSATDVTAFSTATSAFESNEITPLATAPGTINASIIDDSGLPIDLNGSADVALMSYQQQQNHITKYYNLRIELTDLAPSLSNTLTIALPVGMKFYYTNITNFLSQAGQFALDVASSSFTRTAPNIDGYVFPNGTYSFTLKTGVAATTVSIPLSFDPTVNTTTITNAAQVTLSDGTATASQTLEQVTRQTDKTIMFGTNGGHPHPGDYFVFTGGDQLRLPNACRTMCTVIDGSNPFQMLVTGGTFTLKLTDTHGTSGVRAQLINTDTTGEWNMNSNVSTGEYTFTYTPAGGCKGISSLVVPFDVEFASSPSPAWAQDDEVFVTYVASGSCFSFRQFAENDPSGNIGSSINAASATYYLDTDYSHKLRYQEPEEKVYVNYANNSKYLAQISAGPHGSLSFSSDIDCADPNPALNDETGVLGYFLIGNAGSVASAPKTVEMHFDTTTYGVMALHVPFRANEKLTQVEYKTSANRAWQTGTVNAPADCFGTAYLS